ncbi:MAG: SHOCT domain-containing protein [Acetobacteraceae bacterium]
MQELTPDVGPRLDEIARRHGVSLEAAETLLRALWAGGGEMAQFSCPELGGMGQWTPGMTMVGDMFNQDLKAKVHALCTDLAAMLRETGSPLVGSHAAGASGGASGSWWPEDLGPAAASGAQNDMRYAYFPARHRLAVQDGGQISLYDTKDCDVFGVAQQQGAGQSLTFSTNRGPVRLADLPRVDAEAAPSASTGPGAAATSPAAPPAPPAATGSTGHDPLAALERLAELHAKGVLTDDEFARKKAELLGRL